LKEKFIFMHISDFLHQLNSKPETLGFSDTMATIDANYLFTATEFSNGDMHNAAGQNSGSCKLFAFAKLHQFTEAQTLACFGVFWRLLPQRRFSPSGCPRPSEYSQFYAQRLGWYSICSSTIKR
jgi:hypothetical protein